MSFADLRSARKSKESKSFVKKPQDYGSLDTRNGSMDTGLNATAGTPPADDPAVLTDIPLDLPPWLNVRKSAARGRGLYVKENFAPGKSSLTDL